MANKKHLYWAFQSSQTFQPTEEELDSFSRKYKKDFETRELYQGTELLDMYRLHGWRNPMYSFISSIILGYEHEGKLRVKYITGEEKDLLQNFTNLLKNHFQEYNLVHFDAEIVLPYLGVRLNRNGHINPPHVDLRYFSLRPWNLTGVDIKQYYKGAGKYSFSLKDIAFNFNIDSSEIIENEDEFSHYNSGNLESLKNSAIKKVELIAKIHRILSLETALETVFIEETVENVEEQESTNWLSVLYRENNLSKDVQQGIKELVGKKRLTKKDKENLFTILRGVYVHTNFEQNDNDSKKIIEQKESEINEFVNTL